MSDGHDSEKLSPERIAARRKELLKEFSTIDHERTATILIKQEDSPLATSDERERGDSHLLSSLRASQESVMSYTRSHLLNFSTIVFSYSIPLST